MLAPRLQPFSKLPAPASGPLSKVDHWLVAFRPFPKELVVHSKKWTTGSRLFGLLT